MVGNGITDPYADSANVALIPFLYGHGVISTKTWNEVYEYCNDTTSPQCQDAVSTITEMMNDIDVSDALYI